MNEERDRVTEQPDDRRRTGYELLPRSVKVAFITFGVVSTVILGLLGLVVSQNRELAEDGRKARDVLCVDRANWIVRRDRADELLKQPGDTIIYLGLRFPRDEVVRSRLEAETNIRASDPLDCEPLPPPTTSTEGMP